MSRPSGSVADQVQPPLIDLANLHNSAVVLCLGSQSRAKPLTFLSKRSSAAVCTSFLTFLSFFWPRTTGTSARHPVWYLGPTALSVACSSPVHQSSDPTRRREVRSAFVTFACGNSSSNLPTTPSTTNQSRFVRLNRSQSEHLQLVSSPALVTWGCRCSLHLNYREDRTSRQA